MRSMNEKEEKYGEKEAQARFQAALRGARLIGHAPLKDKPKVKKAKKAQKASIKE
jgi:hypothetical protein